MGEPPNHATSRRGDGSADPVEWSLSPQSSLVSQLSLIAYVSLSGGFLVFLFGAIVILLPSIVTDPEVFLIVLLSLLILFVRARFLFVLHRRLYSEVREYLGWYRIGGAVVLGSAGYGVLFSVRPLATVVVFAGGAMGTAVVIRLLGMMTSAGRFDPETGMLEYDDSDRIDDDQTTVDLIDVTSYRSVRVGDVSFLRLSTDGWRTHVLSVPAEQSERIEQYLGTVIGERPPVNRRIRAGVGDTLSELGVPNAVLVLFGLSLAGIGLGTAALSSHPQSIVIAFLLSPVGLILVLLGFQV